MQAAYVKTHMRKGRKVKSHIRHSKMTNKDKNKHFYEGLGERLGRGAGKKLYEKTVSGRMQKKKDLI